MLCFTLSDKLAAALVVENMRPPDTLAKPATCRASDTLRAMVPDRPRKKTKKELKNEIRFFITV